MNAYLIFILIIIAISYILDLLIELLNLNNLSPVLPEEFKDTYDNEKYTKSQLYLKENTKTGIISKTFFTAVILVFLLLGGFNYVDKISRGFGFGPIVTGLIFTGILIVAMQILELPFDIYDTFVIENKYGFNRTTPLTYILDILKGAALGIILGAPIYSCILWFFGRFGTWAWALCWLALVAFQLFVSYLAPVIIMPIFNKFVPLEDGELKNAVEDYAHAQNFKMKGLFKMDGSKRSTKSNAFFTGFGKFRRIVLFDTLIEKHTVKELVSVLGHEMGHYKKRHILKNMLISIANMGVLFFILSLFINNAGLFQAFRMENISIYGSFVFFGFIYSPVLEIISLLGNYLSRKYEYEADAYAAETLNDSGPMISALKKLSADNLSNLTPHPLMVFVKYSHPPVLQRIERIRRFSQDFSAPQRPLS